MREGKTRSVLVLLLLLLLLLMLLLLLLLGCRYVRTPIFFLLCLILSRKQSLDVLPNSAAFLAQQNISNRNNNNLVSLAVRGRNLVTAMKSYPSSVTNGLDGRVKDPTEAHSGAR